MSITRAAKAAEKIFIDNSPVVLTAVGVAGTISTAIFAGRASFKAAQLIEQEESMRRVHRNDFEPLSNKEIAELTWRLYIPATGVGIATIISIICANQISMRRAAAMAAAYSVTEKAFVEYKDKVIDQIGATKEEKIRAEIAQDRVRENTVIHTFTPLEEGDVACLDKYTGRVWSCNMEAVKKAQNDLNYQLLNDGYASLNEFYSKVGLEHIPAGEEVGWNSDTLMEVKFDSVLNDKGRPVLVVEFHVVPVRDFFRWR